jgi:hypothetical protein
VRFIAFEDVKAFFEGKSVCIVGSAPSVLDNDPGWIDSHDVVVRVNNHKCGDAQGFRTDVHYAFYGTSIRVRAETLQKEGVKLCMCKCPDAKPLQCEWHDQLGKAYGTDFRYIYRLRRNWWFTDTYVPSVERFMDKFHVLGKHIPTTGFSAILDVLACEPRSCHLTGFDFFTSGLHNVDEHWKPGDPADPIGHRPELEAQWLNWNAGRLPITFDAKLNDLLRCAV